MNKKLSMAELRRLSLEEYRSAKKLHITILLDDIRSQFNIGSIFRSCDAFRIEEVVLCGICAVPPSAEIHKAALGAEESVKWRYCKSSIDAAAEMKNSGYSLIAAEQTENSVMLGKFQLESAKKYAIVFGNEVKGVKQEIIDICDTVLEIPQFGTKHSLNVAVSAGIILWEMIKGSSGLY